MEELFIYLLKSSGLIAAFFLSYHFLLRKETFFNSNRWFLLAGLITSVLLPLFFIKKVIFVERPKVVVEDFVGITNEVSSNVAQVSPTLMESIDWVQLVAISYVIVVLALILKVLFNILSLFRLLHNKKIEKEESYAFVDLQENIAPFSFFNFIVFNSSLYTQHEMESILLHEKVHSRQKHSADVMVAKLFCVLFWFNPFVWLYKKAIVQNLEYIADSKAVQLIEDKRVYQKALLKVVTHQNCLSITNHFYQSLIKKRIVMLNKNQSHKRNSWKYAVVIPALIAFIVLFQVKIIAQEIASTEIEKNVVSDAVYVTIHKNSTDADMKKSSDLLKENYDVKLKFSKIKRNANGEIIAIKAEFKDKNGNSGVTQFNGKDPIKPIHFFKTDNKIGFGKTSGIKVYQGGRNDEKRIAIAVEAPEAPESPEAPEAIISMEALEDLEDAPEALEILEDLAPLNAIGSNGQSRIVIQNDDDEEIVIVNGKIIKGGKKLSQKDLKKALKGYNYTFTSDDDERIVINGKNIAKIKGGTMEDVRMQMKRMSPEIKRSMERARAEMQRARPEMERAREDMERSRPEMEKAREEMLQARKEMLEARAEMEKAKADLEKAKADLKNKK